MTLNTPAPHDLRPLRRVDLVDGGGGPQLTSLDPAMASGASRWRAVMAAAGVVVVDQVSKYIFSSWSCGSLVCPVRNRALFLGAGADTSFQTLIIGCIGIAVFAVWAAGVLRRTARARLGLAVAGAGVVANLVDRIALAGVRDFLAVPGGIVLNVADVAILAGLVWALSVSRRPGRG